MTATSGAGNVHDQLILQYAKLIFGLCPPAGFSLFGVVLGLVGTNYINSANAQQTDQQTIVTKAEAALAAKIKCGDFRKNANGTWTSGPNTKIGANAFPEHIFDIHGVSIGGADLATVLNRKCGVPLPQKRPPIESSKPTETSPEPSPSQESPEPNEDEQPRGFDANVRGSTGKDLKNMRTASLIMLSGLFAQVARADEIRHTTFPNVMLGTWAETAEQCAAKDKTNILIEPAKYRDGGGDCAVRWIVETAGSDGINYAVHSLCISASLPEKTQTKDIIVRPLGPDRAAMGRSFEDLKNYQRCP